MKYNPIIDGAKYKATASIMSGSGSLQLPEAAIHDERSFSENTEALSSHAKVRRESAIKKNILGCIKRPPLYPNNIFYSLSAGEFFPLQQNGETCKITALANIDSYYSHHYSVKNIPTRKNSNSIYNNELNYPACSEGVKNSVRQIAKKYGSVQGEVLRFEDLEKMAAEMGYLTTSISPENSNDFAHHITEQLLNAKPILAFFAVETDDPETRGHPTKQYNNNEHACLIVGVNTKEEKLTIAQWGRFYSDIPMDDFYQSMCALPATREAEYYKKTNKEVGSIGYVKYNLVSKVGVDTHGDAVPCKLNVNNKDNILNSITPEEHTGFRNRMLILTPHLENVRWQQDNTDKSIPYRSRHGLPEVSLNSHVTVECIAAEPHSLSLTLTEPIIWCRHFSQMFAEYPGKKRDLMREFSTYTGVSEKFEGKLQPTEVAFINILKETPQSNKHVVLDDQFGVYLEALANELHDPTEKSGNASMVNCILITGVHAMALQVEKKNKNESSYFSVKLYDPNTTANYRRVERLCSADLCSLRPKDFFIRPEFIDAYDDDKSNSQSL